MKTTLRNTMSIGLLVVLSAVWSLAQTTVWRGLQAAHNGRAKTSPSQFRIDPSARFPGRWELSTFDTGHRTDRPCQLGVVIEANGTVRGLPGYQGEASPPPDGHYSILVPAGTDREAAKQAFSDYATSPFGQALMEPAICRVNQQHAGK